METILKTFVAALATFTTYFFGGADMWLMALIAVVAADYVTGFARAFILGELSSKAGLKGIVKKLMYFAIVGVAVIADSITGADPVIRTMVIGFLIANEALSILENCARSGLPVPKLLISTLNKLKQEDSE